jgi:hypothetical protein
MHDVVRSRFQTKLLGPLRRLSFAGNGLPERMRSTAFAFLGLTAAAGLALVAIFAQLSFPLLSPAPLPGGPDEGNAISKAVALDRGPRAFERANPDPGRSGQSGVENDEGASSGDGSGGQSAEPTGVGPVPTQPNGGTSGGKAVETPTSSPSPAPDPSSEPAPKIPAAAPGPAPTPAPARPAVPTPPPAPGNSRSSAAASHASERGVEASSKSTPESTASGAATSGTSTPEASPGNGNGKALGQGK